MTFLKAQASNPYLQNANTEIVPSVSRYSCFSVHRTDSTAADSYEGTIPNMVLHSGAAHFCFNLNFSHGRAGIFLMQPHYSSRMGESPAVNRCRVHICVESSPSCFRLIWQLARHSMLSHVRSENWYSLR